MYDPKQVLTESGYMTYLLKVQQLREAVRFFANAADDLHYSDFERPDGFDFEEALYELDRYIASGALTEGPFDSGEDE